MVKWKLCNGLVAEIGFNGSDNLIKPWGIETADSWGFFSLDKSVGQRYTINRSENTAEKDELQRTSIDVSMPEGRWMLHCSDQLLNNSDGSASIVRIAELVALEDTILMDFVLRFRFLKSYFSKAEINGNQYDHSNSNTYYQHKVSNATLNGNGITAKIHIEDVEITDNFSKFLYVRDREDEWIVHARMLPEKSHKDVIKLCNRWCKTSPLPQSLTNILLKSKIIKDALWYRNERSPYRLKLARIINPNAFAMGMLRKGEKLKWVVRCHLR